MDEYPKIFLLPATDAELTRSGVLLYLIGLLCTFSFFAQFGILSVDMLKPQAIIIGLYVWIWAVCLPRLLILLNANLKFSQKWLYVACVWTSLTLVNLTILITLGAKDWWLKGILICLLQFFYYTDFRPWQITTSPKLFKNLILLPLLGYCFAMAFLPLIPQALGGTKPSAVTVTFKDPKKDLLVSRFTARPGEYDFLYETGTDYYFLETLEDLNSKTVLGYVVKRIAKNDVAKLEFHTSIWSNF